MKNIHLYMKNIQHKPMDYEETLFTKAFGNTPIVRVWDNLIGGRHYDHSLTEIAEESCVAWSTIHTIIPALENQGFIKKTREIGRAKMYQINKENAVAKILIDTHKKIILASIKERMSKENIVNKN